MENELKDKWLKLFTDNKFPFREDLNFETEAEYQVIYY